MDFRDTLQRLMGRKRGRVETPKPSVPVDEPRQAAPAATPLPRPEEAPAERVDSSEAALRKPAEGALPLPEHAAVERTASAKPTPLKPEPAAKPVPKQRRAESAASAKPEPRKPAAPNRPDQVSAKEAAPAKPAARKTAAAPKPQPTQAPAVAQPARDKAATTKQEAPKATSGKSAKTGSKSLRQKSPAAARTAPRPDAAAAFFEHCKPFAEGVALFAADGSVRDSFPPLSLIDWDALGHDLARDATAWQTRTGSAIPGTQLVSLRPSGSNLPALALFLTGSDFVALAFTNAEFGRTLIAAEKAHGWQDS
jgi:hypothetical protein